LRGNRSLIYVNMTISIQPLDSYGNPTDKSFTSDYTRFLDLNDGFSIEQIAQMTSILNIGGNYLIGGGAAGGFRLKKVIALKLGDRVKVTSIETPTGDDSFLGKTGVIVHIYEPDANYSEEGYSVRLDDGKQDMFYADELTKVPDES
jgi:hypothetical protein